MSVAPGKGWRHYRRMEGKYERIRKSWSIVPSSTCGSERIVMRSSFSALSSNSDDVGDARTHDLINVGFGQDFSANGNTFGHEIERYTQADYSE